MSEQVVQPLSDVELRALLASCPNKDSGCLADIPREVVDARHGVGDMLIRHSRMSFISAAAAAGVEGRLLDDAVYYETTLVEHQPTLENGSTLEIVNGEPTTVGAEIEKYPYVRRMASCAYTCGKSTDCVLKGKS